MAAESEPVVEHATKKSGGDGAFDQCGPMLVRSSDPTAEVVYPLEQWIRHCRYRGEKIYRRTIKVVSDWEEIGSGG